MEKCKYNTPSTQAGRKKSEVELEVPWLAPGSQGLKRRLGERKKAPDTKRGTRNLSPPRS